MKRSKYNLSGKHIGSCDIGELIPIGWKALLPGDTVRLRTNMLIRVSPLLAPVMHKVNVRVHHFFVPNRLIWAEFEKFITGGPDGNDATVHPFITTPADTGFGEGSLGDYLGLQPGVPNIPVSALPFRAFNAIFNEYYRDQDIMDIRPFVTTSGSDATTQLTTLNMRVSWKKDYFSVCRPWTQKGTDVMLPFPAQLPVLYNDDTTDPWLSRYSSDNVPTTGENPGSVNIEDTDSSLYGNRDAGVDGLKLDPNGGLYAFANPADMANAEDLRTMFALQRYKENRARFGSRFTEYLQFLGVRAQDSRLQRPEYVGGGKSIVQFSEVMQTSPDIGEEGETENFGVAELKGHGVAHARANGVNYFAPEHGILMTLFSVVPDAIYQNSVDREWLKTTKEDYWQKELEHIGQQETYKRELQFGHADGMTVPFGYNNRYEEYRHGRSQISGEMRTSLNFWHMARSEADPLALNPAFLQCSPSKRNFSIQSRDTLWFMANHKMTARRLVSNNTQSYVR